MCQPPFPRAIGFQMKIKTSWTQGQKPLASDDQGIKHPLLLFD